MKHLEIEKTRWRKRRILGLPIPLAVFMALAGAAVAAYLVLLTLGGTVTTGQFALAVDGAPVSTPAGGGTCTIAGNTATNIGNITWTNPIAGSTCTVMVGVLANASNAGSATLEQFELVTDNPGISASLVAGATNDCGAVWTPGQLKIVDVVLSVTQDASPGSTIQLTGSNLRFAPSAAAVTTGCL